MAKFSFLKFIESLSIKLYNISPLSISSAQYTNGPYVIATFQHHILLFYLPLSFSIQDLILNI